MTIQARSMCLYMSMLWVLNPYLFDLQVNRKGEKPCAYPRPLAMVDPNIGANEQEWKEDLVTSFEEVQTYFSSVEWYISQ